MPRSTQGQIVICSPRQSGPFTIDPCPGYGINGYLPVIAVLRIISPQVSTNQSGKAFMPPMVRASTIRSWSDGIPDWRRNRFPSIASSFPTSFWNLDAAFSGTG